jgi:hypothetical protein
VDRRTLVAAGTIALALAATGCGASPEGSAPAPTPTPRDCRSLTFPYPTADATLTAADNGKTVHVPIGGLVEVDLLGSASRRWSPIIQTGTSVVSLGTQAETPTVGTRLGEYCAAGNGTASLSAGDGTVRWTADIVVP